MVGGLPWSHGPVIKADVLDDAHFLNEREEGLSSSSIYGLGVQAGPVESSGLLQRRAAPAVLRL